MATITISPPSIADAQPGSLRPAGLADDGSPFNLNDASEGTFMLSVPGADQVPGALAAPRAQRDSLITQCNNLGDGLGEDIEDVADEDCNDEDQDVHDDEIENVPRPLNAFAIRPSFVSGVNLDPTKKKVALISVKSIQEDVEEIEAVDDDNRDRDNNLVSWSKNNLEADSKPYDDLDSGTFTASTVPSSRASTNDTLTSNNKRSSKKLRWRPRVREDFNFVVGEAPSAFKTTKSERRKSGTNKYQNLLGGRRKSGTLGPVAAAAIAAAAKAADTDFEDEEIDGVIPQAGNEEEDSQGGTSEVATRRGTAFATKDMVNDFEAAQQANAKTSRLLGMVKISARMIGIFKKKDRTESQKREDEVRDFSCSESSGSPNAREMVKQPTWYPAVGGSSKSKSQVFV